MEVVKYIFPITPRFNVGHKKGIKLKYVGLHCSTLSQNLISILFRIFRATALKHIHIRRQFFLHLSNQMGWKGICLCLRGTPAGWNIIFLPILYISSILIKYFASPLREISLHSEIEFMLIKTAINQIVIILPNISTCELGKIFSLIQSVLIFRVITLSSTTSMEF